MTKTTKIVTIGDLRDAKWAAKAKAEAKAMKLQRAKDAAAAVIKAILHANPQVGILNGKNGKTVYYVTDSMMVGSIIRRYHPSQLPGVVIPTSIGGF